MLLIASDKDCTDQRWSCWEKLWKAHGLSSGSHSHAVLRWIPSVGQEWGIIK